MHVTYLPVFSKDHGGTLQRISVEACCEPMKLDVSPRAHLNIESAASTMSGLCYLQTSTAIVLACAEVKETHGSTSHQTQAPEGPTSRWAYMSARALY